MGAGEGVYGLSSFISSSGSQRSGTVNLGRKVTANVVLQRRAYLRSEARAQRDRESGHAGPQRCLLY